jgi:hypothetical protein
VDLKKVAMPTLTKSPMNWRRLQSQVVLAETPRPLAEEEGTSPKRVNIRRKVAEVVAATSYKAKVIIAVAAPMKSTQNCSKNERSWSN